MNGEMDYFYATAHLNGELTPEFTEAAFSLKNNGDVCAPFRTAYGFHILKRLDLKPLPSYEEMKPVLKQNISGDSRSYKSTQAMIAKIKQEYGFKEYPENLKKFTATLDSSLLKAMWLKGSGPMYSLPLFSLGTEEFNADRFAGFMVAMQRPSKLKQVANVVGTYYKNWVDASCIDYLDRHLNEKYPEFAALYQEYREGILLFNLAQEKVWNKAIRDTSGLEAFYKANNSRYSWNDRYQVTIYNARTEAIMKSVSKMIKKKISDDSIYRYHTKESLLNLSIQDGKFEWKDSNAFVNELFAAGKKYQSKKNYTWVMGQRGNDQWLLMRIHQYLPAGAKALDETRGPVISDYQVVLEDAWVDEVAQRYPVKVNERVYQQLKERLIR
jgi:peptidyl-prolyl cis-trans isomerase SurA